ncbi:MAG: hypothetical protein WBG42_02630 [Cryomorphaceae bacterium]
MRNIQAEMIATIKDIVALSAVSERTAKRRLSEMPRATPFRDLRHYCKVYKMDFERALAFKLAKRYDPFYRSRSVKKEQRPFSYSIDTWEEPYRVGNEVRKVLFHEAKFYGADGKDVTGAMRYFSFPVVLLDCADDLHLPLLSEFVEKALPVEPKVDLLQFFGLMVVKRAHQRRIAFLEQAALSSFPQVYFAKVLKKEYQNTKKIWFCKIDSMSAEDLQTFGFREIAGTGFAVSGVPGSEVKGKVEVRIERGEE